MRHSICLAYLRNTLFPVDPRDEIPPWLGFRAADDKSRLPLSFQCLQALAQALFGRVQGLPAVATEGSRLYVASLQRLNVVLGQQKPDDDHALAVLILGAYEMFILSSPTGWIDHSLGLGSVLETRGPHAFTTGIAHALFESSRFIIILASLAVSKHTFLSRDDWKTVPWSKDPAAKGPLDELLDIVADLPRIKELRTRGDEDASKLRREAAKVVADLRTWRRIWDATPTGHITQRHTVSPKVDAMHFDSTILDFTSIHAATYACIYDAALILAIELLGAGTSYGDTVVQSGLLSASSLPPSPDDVPSADTDVMSAYMQCLSHAAAIEICRSMSFQLRSTNTLTGQFLVLYPLRMAWKALGGPTRVEGRWVQALLTELGKDPTKRWGVLRQVINPF